MKITIVAWGSELLQFSGAAREAGIDLSAWQVHELIDDSEKRKRCIESCRGSDVVLVHPSNDSVWDEILGGLAEGIPVISFGYTDAWWSASTVPLAVVSAVSAYFLYGGPENIRNLIHLAARYCHRLLILKEGLVLGWGTPSSLLSGEMVRAAYSIEASVKDEMGVPYVVPLRPSNNDDPVKIE